MMGRWSLQHLTARLFGSEGSLGQRMAKASVWTVGTMLGVNFLRLGSNLITTRLLVPEAFALVAIAITIEGCIKMFVDFGVPNSIQREKDGATPHFLRVAWTLLIIVMSCVTCILLIVAGSLWFFAESLFPAGSVYTDPLLPPVLAVVAFLPILKGLQSTNIVLAIRNLNFRLVGLLDLSATMASITAMIAFLLISPTVWGLVFGVIVNAVSMTLLTHTLIPGPRMSLAWDSEIFSRIWRYGKFILGSTPLTFISTQGDRFIFAALLDTKTFGIYSIAQVWISALNGICGSLSTRVGFSGLAEVYRKNPAALPSRFVRVQIATDIMFFACFATVALGGPVLVNTLYTETYAMVGDILVVLSLTFLFGRTRPAGQYLLTIGKSKEVLYLAAIRAFGLIIFSLLGFHFFGLKGALFGIGLSQLSALPLQMVVIGREVPGYNRREFLWCAVYIVGSLAVLWQSDL